MGLSKAYVEPEQEQEVDLQAEVDSMMEEDGSAFDPVALGTLEETEAEESTEASAEVPATEAEKTPDQPEAEATAEKEAEATAAAEKKAQTEAAAERAKQQDVLQSDYTNPIAQILDMIGKALNGTIVGTLFTSVAAKMEKTTNPAVQDIYGDKAEAESGMVAKTKVLDFMRPGNTDEVVASLADAGTPSANGGYMKSGAIEDIKDAVAHDASIDPTATASAILRFDKSGKGHIDAYQPRDDASEEVVAAMAEDRERATVGLRESNAAMVETYYGQMMELERSGQEIPPEAREKMSHFTEMEGINVDYDHWYQGVDVTAVQDEATATQAAEFHQKAVAYELPPDDAEKLMEGTAAVGAASQQEETKGAVSAKLEGVESTFHDRAATNPDLTANAILKWGKLGQANIDNFDTQGQADLEQYKADAQLGFQKISGSMVEGFYGQMMEREQAGYEIPESVRAKMDSFVGINGIEVDYGHWSTGVDVTVPIGADAADAAALRHQAEIDQGVLQNPEMDAVAQANPTVMEDWKDQAMIDFQENNYADVKDSPTMVHQAVVTAHENLLNNTVDEVENKTDILANEYMQAGAGIQTYYQTSSELIDNSDLPEDQKALMRTDLQSAMKSQVTELYESAYHDNTNLGEPIFSEDQKSTLSFNIPGVNVSFADFKPGMDVGSGLMPVENEPKLMEEMSAEQMASLDEMNESDKEAAGCSYEVSSHALQASSGSHESVFVDTPSKPMDQPSRTGEAQRKTTVPEVTPEATPDKNVPSAEKPSTSGADRAKQAEDLFGHITGANKGRGKTTDYTF